MIGGVVHNPADLTEDPDPPFAGSPTKGLHVCVLQLVRASDIMSLYGRGTVPLSSAWLFLKADKPFPQAPPPSPNRCPSRCVA